MEFFVSESLEKSGHFLFDDFAYRLQNAQIAKLKTVIPMLSRLKKCRDIVRLATANGLDVLDHTEYKKNYLS